MKTTPSEERVERRGRPAAQLKGKRFGQLVAKEPGGRNAQNTRLWRCVCSCGNERLCTAADLQAGRRTACSHCSHLRAARARARSHWDGVGIGPVTAMRDAGKTFREIASLMGVSRQSVYARLKKERALAERGAAAAGGGAA